MNLFEYPEGATPIDPDEAEGLKPTHIVTRGELNRWEQDNILKAIIWSSNVQPDSILTLSFIQTLHKRMLGDVWDWAGTFRQSDKSIGIPWYNIQAALHNLCEDTRAWMEAGEDFHECGVRFHHRLVYIHPFPNGNGRHARLMTDLLLERVFSETRFTWGSGEVSTAGHARQHYIEALRAADAGDLNPLRIFVKT